MSDSIKSAWFKPALKYASLGAISCVLVFFITWLLKIDPLGDWKIIASVPCFLVIYLAVKNYRDVHADGIVKISSAYIYGLYINALIGLLTGIFVYLFLEFVDPSINQTHIASLKEYIKASTTYNAQTKLSLTADVEKTSAFNMGVDEWVKRVGSGFFYVLLAAAIVKR